MASSRWRFRVPSIPAVLFVVLAGSVPILLQKPMLNSDGDVARHLRHGQYMLQHGAIIRTDPFSFTRPGAPFVGFEYGSQILYALAERTGGLPAVAILAGLLIALTYSLLTRFLLQRGVDPLLACLTVGLAAALGAGHWSARPHLFSFLAVVLLLELLEGAPRKRLLKCGLLFLIWANVHGGFVYGWILIGLYLLGSWGELRWGSDREAWSHRVRYYLGMLLVAVIATLVNPSGVELHRHVLDFFGLQFMLDNTAEFDSPNFHDPDGKVFLAALLLTLAPLSLYGRRPALPRLLVVCAGIAFALISLRNIPLFGLTALPLFALHTDPSWRRLPYGRGLRDRFAATASRTSTIPWVLLFGAIMAGLGVARGRAGPIQLIADRFDATVFPVAAVEKGRKERLQGNLFGEFAWGGYLVYAWPEQKIFIDGGTDFFGDDIFRQYAKIKQMMPGWRELLKKWNISLMLLKRESSLVHELARDGRWSLWYCDSLAVLLRSAAPPLALTPSEADAVEGRLDNCGQPMVDMPGLPGTPAGTKPSGRLSADR
jgi:hypothetical protein